MERGAGEELSEVPEADAVFLSVLLRPAPAPALVLGGFGVVVEDSVLRFLVAGPFLATPFLVAVFGAGRLMPRGSFVFTVSVVGSGEASFGDIVGCKLGSRLTEGTGMKAGIELCIADSVFTAVDKSWSLPIEALCVE